MYRQKECDEFGEFTYQRIFRKVFKEENQPTTLFEIYFQVLAACTKYSYKFVVIIVMHVRDAAFS